MTAATIPAAVAWRRWRAPAILIAVIVAAAAIIALLQAGPVITEPLDPADTGAVGTHALAALLAGRGQAVLRETTVPAAARQAGTVGTTVVITTPQAFSGRQLAALVHSPAGLVLVAPGPAALAALAPAMTVAGPAPVRLLPTGCDLPGARLAGGAVMGGLALRVAAPRAWRCYPTSARRGLPSLARYATAWHTVTVLGTGAALSNQYLGQAGNAALALNLLGAGQRVVWLVPASTLAPVGRGGRPVTGLIPGPVYAIVAELVIAALLAAAWRMRRFGPLVSEPLPVVVRACETVEGHGRLYRSRRARGRAAAALRAAALARMTARLGLPPDARAPAACGELARRSGRSTAEVQDLLSGPAPTDDAALVALANDLDTLEGQVLNR